MNMAFREIIINVALLLCTFAAVKIMPVVIGITVLAGRLKIDACFNYHIKIER